MLNLKLKLTRKKIISILVVLFVIIPILLASLGAAYVVYAYHRIDLDRQLEQPSILLDRDGSEIGRISAELRRVISLDDMSPYLIDAILAIEDNRFYDHFGLDPRGIGRAMWRNLTGGRVAEGGSTITQQLAKNEYFIGQQGAARTFERKIREAVYAVKLERTLTKDEILERYLNRIYFGHGRFGVEAASQYYFNKSARDLDLAEAAVLAGIPRGPAIYSLRDNPDRSNQRKNIVLNRMEELGMITRQQSQEAQARNLVAAELQEAPVRARHFRQQVERDVRRILADRYPQLEDDEITNLMYNQGLEIQTTLWLPAQAAAEQVITLRGEEILQNHPNAQASLVAIDPQTGGVMALVNSIDLGGTVRRVYEWRYDLGSAYKGILYTAALQNGYTAASTEICQETEFQIPGQNRTYSPSDWDGGWHNRTLRIREALEVSCNVVAVRVGKDLGLANYLNLVSQLNPRLEERPIGNAAHISLPLQPNSTTLDLTLVHAPLINGGYSVRPHTISEIRDRDGNVLYRNWPDRGFVLDERLGYITTNILQGVQGIRTGVPFDVAGKTGTGEDGRIATFVGYTSDMVATIWFGFDNPQQNQPLGTAVGIAAPAWRDFINRAYGDNHPEPFQRPPGLEEAVICAVSGQLATPYCPETYTEFFMPGTVPTQRCEVHSGNTIEICRSTGMPANPYCPDELRQTIIRPPWISPNFQCWVHGPGPGDEPPDEPGDLDDEYEDEADDDLFDDDNDEENNND